MQLREYCDRRGWGVAGEYVNLGISGAKEKRLELDRLMGKRLSRPRVTVNRDRIGHLQAHGLSWAKIAAELGIGERTVYRLAHASAKNLPS
jgi:DNA invertase Pin-like site-specific DNA recombinase